MRKALGATVEEECRLGVSKVANVSRPCERCDAPSAPLVPLADLSPLSNSSSPVTSDSCSRTSSPRW